MFPPTLQSVASVLGPVTIVQRYVVSCVVHHRTQDSSVGRDNRAMGPPFTARSTHAICMGPEPGRRVTRSGPISVAGV